MEEDFITGTSLEKSKKVLEFRYCYSVLIQSRKLLSLVKLLHMDWGLLSHIMENGLDRSIAFVRRTLTLVKKKKKNYAQIERDNGYVFLLLKI